MSRCPECGHDPEPLRRARANYERRRKDRRAAAKRRKREADAELAKLGILPTKPGRTAQINTQSAAQPMLPP